MANSKISELAAKATVAGTEELAINDSGTSKKMTIAVLQTAPTAHAAATTAHGATGAVVGTTNTQTLTNKTLTSPVINSPTGITKTDVGLSNVPNTNLTPRQAAYQAVTYAATITLDPTAGAVVQIGALTGNLTLAAPTSPANGDMLQINLLQDATGGRTVTFNAIFDADSVAKQVVETGANKRSQLAFVYSGSVWQ